MDKCIYIDEYTSFRVDSLFAPTFSRCREKWVVKFLKSEYLASPPPHPTLRLFLDRSGYDRNPVNADRVKAILSRYNFEFFNPAAHPASYKVFSEASIVVGATGSALAGLAFCQPGTKVLELICTDMPWTRYHDLSEAAGLDYGYLVCKSKQIGKTITTFHVSHLDYYVNEDELEQALLKMIRDL